MSADVDCEIDLERIRDLYSKCFREVIAEVGEDPFSTGELQAWVEERFDARFRLERRLSEWFRSEFAKLLASKYI